VRSGRSGPLEDGRGGPGRTDDPRTVAIVAGITNGSDRQGDGGAKVDGGRAIETSSGEGADRARRRQRQVASAGLTAEEIADLLAPGPAAQCERWIKPLVVYDFRSVKE
jgi:hypothetical protein